MDYEIAVTCAFGVETSLKRELKPYVKDELRAVDGRISFRGDDLTIARLNVNLRTCDRVYISLKTFPCETFDMLFEGAKNFPWEEYIGVSGKIIVNGKSVKSKLFSLSDCQKILKKAIISRLSEKFRRTVFPENGETYEILFSIKDDVCTLLLNTSGKGLHKRGYRDLVGAAPIKETLAAALIDLSGVSADHPLIDPFCGSGTIVIEGALKALNIAPGKNRDFDFSHWKFFDKTALPTALEEALDRENPRKIDFAGYDIDNSATKLALRHAERAGVKDYVHFQTRDVKELSTQKKDVIILTNPPYGERLMTPTQTRELYKLFGQVCRNIDCLSVNVITAAEDFETYFGRRATKNRKFFNANKECRFYRFVATALI